MLSRGELLHTKLKLSVSCGHCDVQVGSLIPVAIIAELDRRGLVRTISAVPPPDIVYKGVSAALREAGFADDE